MLMFFIFIRLDFLRRSGIQIWINLEVLMKELDRIRLKDYAFVDQEIEHGVRSLAVPVFNQSGESVAAISMLTNASTVTKKKLINDYLPMLWDAAQEIKQVLAS